MQQVITIIFWASLILLLYGYIIYGVLISFFNLFKRPRKTIHPSNQHHTIAVLVAAFNEEDIIERKILNTLQLNYPKDKVNFYFITDGSADDTYNICLKYPDIQTYHVEQRLGKLGSLQRIIPTLSEDILLFSDANCMVNREALIELIAHFNDPRIGAVSGEKKVISSSEATGSEGLYWKYESWLKKGDANFYSLVGAAGELFAIRRILYTMLPDNIILDDFVQSMKVCEQGYIVDYEEKAFALETPSANIREEFKRKARICAGAFQSFPHISFAFNPFNQPKVFFQFISHRFFRWTIGPILLVLLLISNILLFSTNELYQYSLVLQLLFYFVAITGFILSMKNKKAGLYFIPMYFVLMNGAVFAGLFKYIKGTQSNLWEKSSRKLSMESEK